MAEVFRARAFDASGTLHDVVVKKILPHHSEEADFKTMFMDEARIASKLDHPNVVRVLDLGRLDGDLFLTMEFVEGTDLLHLAEWMEGAGRKMPIATAIHLTMEILKGLHHAHTRVDPAGQSLGIVHRDVTPQNVLVGINGAVKLTDFGIARAANRISHTMVGTIKGNLLYSAPEQVAGTAIDLRADVYSAGILLHRLLAGRHAFDGDDLPKIYQRALSGDIPPVSGLNPSVPTNLDRIVSRATALHPDQRFATADEFRRALEDFLLGKQLAVDMQAICSDVRAMRSGLRAAVKPKNDGRVLVSQGGSDQSVLSSVAAAAAATPRDGPTTVQRMTPVAPPVDVDEPTTVQSILPLRRAPDAETVEPSIANLALEDTPAPELVLGGDDDNRARLANVPPTRTPVRTPAQRELDEWVANVGEPEEKTLSMPIESLSAPAAPMVEDETTRNVIPPPRTPAKSDAPVDGGGARVASTILMPAKPTPSAGTLAARPAPSKPGTPILSSRPPALVAPDSLDAAPTAIMSPDLVSGPAPGTPVLSSRPPLVSVLPDDVAPTNVIVDSELQASPASTPARPPTLTDLPPPPSLSNTQSPSRRAPAPLPPWETLRARGATPPHDRTPMIGATVELDDSPDLPPVMGTIAATAPVVRPDLDADGPLPSWAAAPARSPAGTPAKANDWLPAKPSPTPVDVSAPAIVPPLVAKLAPAESVESTASPFDDLVEPEASTRTAMPMSTSPAPAPAVLGVAPAAALDGHTGVVAAVAAVRVGRFIVSASHDHTLRVWDITRQTTQVVLKGHTGPVTCVALGDDGSRVISGGADQTVRLWNTENGQVLASMRGHVEPVLACAVAPDGRTALSGGQDRSVRLWDLSTGHEQLVMQGHEQAVAVLAYAGDGTLAVSASLDGMIQMWNLLDGSMLAMFPTGVLGLRALALAKDGRRLVFGGADGQIRMWDVEQGAPLLTFDGTQGGLLAATLSPDGNSVVTAGEDGTARVWDLATGKPGAIFGTQAGALHSVAFAIDGHSLIGATGRRVCVWDLP